MMLEFDPFYWHVVRWLMASLFAVAVAHKLTSVATFEGVVRNYGLLPAAMAPFASRLIIVLEATVVLGLVSGLWLPGAAGLAIALLTIYGAGMAINLSLGRRDIDCGCFGPAGNAGSRHALSGWLLLRNLLLIAVTVFLFIPVTARDLTALDLATIVAATVAGLVIYSAADQLIANAPRQAGLLR